MAIDTVSLGETGLSVSELAFGTWRFGRPNDAGDIEIGRERAMALLDTYAANGGRFIDTADVYGDGRAERWIGDWLDDRDRESYVIASKVYFPTREGDPNGKGLNRKHLHRQLDASLNRLGTSYLDILYIHRWDDRTPVDKFMRTLAEFVDDGRVLYLGTSTKTPNAWRVAMANERARRRGWEPFTVAQPRYNLVNRAIEGNYLEMCREYGIAVVPWSPLAEGFLTGKYERSADPPAGSRGATDRRFAERYLESDAFDVLDSVRSVAESVVASPTQVALAWLLAHGDVTAPIVGARTPDQLEENVDACSVSLTADQFDRLAAAGAED